MKKISVHADIKEIVRYQFEVEVDDNLSKEQQDKQAKDKLETFLLHNVPYVFQSTPIDGVKCVDSESQETDTVVNIEVNPD